MARKFVFRIDQQGVEELRRNLEKLGKDGQKAFRDLSQASPQLANPLTQAERRIEATRRSLERLGRQGAGHLRGLGVAAGAAARNFLGLNAPIAALAGTAGIGLLARRALEFTDNLQETADMLGLTAEQLQIYQAGALQAGLGTDKLTQGLAVFERKLADAKDGSKEAVTFFRQLNIPILDAAGNLRPLPDLLGEFADRIKNAESPAKALQIVMEAFGAKAGRDFINFLRDGKAGLDDMASSATLAGQIMGNELVRQGALAKDQMDALGLTIRTSFNIGLIESFGGSFAEFARAASDPELQGAVRDLGRSVGELVRSMLDNAPGVLSFLADFVSLLREGSEWAREVVQYLPAVQAFQAGRELIRPSLATGTAGAGAEIAELQRQLAIQQDIKRDPYWLANIIGLTDDKIAALQGRIDQLKGVLGQAKEDTLRQQLGAGQPSAGASPAAGGFQFAPPKDGAAAIDKEARAREQALAALNQMILGYQQEAQLLGLTGAAREQLQARFQAEEILRRANLTLTEQQRAALTAAVAASEEAAAQADAQATAQDRVNDILAEYARIQDAALTPAERYAALVPQLRADLAAGAISQEQFNAAVQALPTVLEQAKTDVDELNQAGRQFTRTLIDWSIEGGNFASLLQSLNNLALEFLANLAQEDIFPTGGGGQTASGANAGGLEALFDSIFGLFHAGGLTDRGAPASRQLDARAFYGAPRLHDGFRPGEFPAILNRGEAVIPLIGGAVPVRMIGGPRGRDREPTVVNHNYFGQGPDGRRPTATQEAREFMRGIQRRLLR